MNKFVEKPLDEYLNGKIDSYTYHMYGKRIIVHNGNSDSHDFNGEIGTVIKYKERTGHTLIMFDEEKEPFHDAQLSGNSGRRNCYWVKLGRLDYSFLDTKEA